MNIEVWGEEICGECQQVKQKLTRLGFGFISKSWKRDIDTLPKIDRADLMHAYIWRKELLPVLRVDGNARTPEEFFKELENA